MFKTLLSIREMKFRMDDDYVDRLSRQYTVIILIFFGFLVSTKQFVGQPINCWCPAQFTKSHRDYADAVCWVSNTYYLPAKDVLAREHLSTQKHLRMISYYQWVPMILIFQATIAFVPCLLWRFLNKRSGVNMAAVMDASRHCSQAHYLEIREKAIRYIVNQMDRYLLVQREYRTGCMVRIKHLVAKFCCFVGGKLYGNYLISCYMAIKLCYLFNALGQLFLLEMLLKIEFHFYGVHVLERWIKGQDWSHSDRFPRVTLCEFEIRHQSRVHNYIVQCALTINLFNEKLFIFIWFWYIFLAFITSINFLRWLFRSLYWPGHIQYIRKQLRAFDATQREAGILTKFAENYLRRDGMFIVRLIGMNMGEVVAGEVISGLWNNYSLDRRSIAEKSLRKGAGKASRNAAGRRLEVV